MMFMSIYSRGMQVANVERRKEREEEIRNELFILNYDIDDQFIISFPSFNVFVLVLV